MTFQDVFVTRKTQYQHEKQKKLSLFFAVTCLHAVKMYKYFYKPHSDCLAGPDYGRDCSFQRKSDYLSSEEAEMRMNSL